MAEHLSDKTIARGNLAGPNPAEEGGSGEPDMVTLHLDSDVLYRWYHEDGTQTDASAPDIHSAFATARVKWPGFALVEYRERLVEAGREKEIANRHAADEREELAQA